ncbi:transposase (plasmid) [Kovacikia minuta CCNUW1]|uniref:REP-associated tyrosine transposase n=1 Tax=Kovacikia minuta TaxID=2931930 RepID=UPI001CCD9215|nr:transposase [Kovacikia minuta]UBF30059.1 transposase [Kovacikia minuta CCNUW1]
MTNYRRLTIAGGTYFFTLVTHQRRPWLCCDIARSTLRAAITHVRLTYPFVIEAMVLLPNHLHCIWTLPTGDSDYATRWRLIKAYVTKQAATKLKLDAQLSQSRQQRREGNLWQRRFWEYWIRDQQDFIRHCDYIHYNPVRHGLCRSPGEWKYSSFHRFVVQGIYPPDWGKDGRVHPSLVSLRVRVAH